MKSRRNWVWFFIKLMPLVLVVLSIFPYIHYFESDNSVTLSFTSWFSSWCGSIGDGIRFLPVRSVLYSIVTRLQNDVAGNYSIISFIINYVSYLVFVEMIRILYEVLVFLPKFANSFFERKLGD